MSLDKSQFDGEELNSPAQDSGRDRKRVASRETQVLSSGVSSLPASNPHEGFIRSHGPALVELGYPIVPIKPGTKRPAQKGWQKVDYNSVGLSRKFTGHGIGVKTGSVVAVDIDSDDAGVVARVVAWIEKNIGLTLERIGRAPRTLLVFKTSAPFRKVQSWAFSFYRDHCVKGWPMLDKDDAQAALQEAKEEAGIDGVISNSPVGSYRYIKLFDDGSTKPAQAVIYSLRVTDQHPKWEEKGQRKRRWFRPGKAAKAVAEPDLARFLANLAAGRVVLT